MCFLCSSYVGVHGMRPEADPRRRNAYRSSEMHTCLRSVRQKSGSGRPVVFKVRTVHRQCWVGNSNEQPFVRNTIESVNRRAEIAMPAVACKPTTFVPRANRAALGLLRKRDGKPSWTPKAGLPSRAEGGHALPNIALPLAVFSDSDGRRTQQRLKNHRFKVLQ